jgi:hypothetical protein
MTISVECQEASTGPLYQLPIYPAGRATVGMSAPGTFNHHVPTYMYEIKVALRVKGTGLLASSLRAFEPDLSSLQRAESPLTVYPNGNTATEL